MAECYPNPIRFSSVNRRKVEADFSGGAISGNGGIPLLGEVDRRLGQTRSVARLLALILSSPLRMYQVFRESRSDSFRYRDVGLRLSQRFRTG